LVVNLIAVADVEAVLGAIAPDRKLNEPRKHLRKPRVELPGIDVIGDTFDDLGTSYWRNLVTA
jgi:hypothetical protein